MKCFFNTKFTKRDYECTNIVACVSHEAPNENFIEMSPKEIHEKGIGNLDKLYTENNVSYFGWL